MKGEKRSVGKGAVAPESAVPLPYARKDLIRIGVRDYRPKAVEILLYQGKIAMNDDGAYYYVDSEVLDH